MLVNGPGMRSARPRLMHDPFMKARAKAIMAGGLAFAGAWLWIPGAKDKTDASVPARTKAKVIQRARDQGGLTRDPVLQSAVVVDTVASSFPPEDCRPLAEAARAVVSPSLREEMTRRAVQEWAVREWAVRDAVAAIGWAAGLSDANESRMAMLQICTRVAEDDPAAAIRLALDHELDRGAGDFIAGLAAGWSARDLPAAREWVESQPQDELREVLMGSIVFELAKSDPSAAARMVAERMGSGEPQMEAAISVVNRWISQDPQAAASWVETFPEGDLKERARRELSPPRDRAR